MASRVPFKALLLDIEGTTTPISFVTDILFPYAQKQYDHYIRTNWNHPDFVPVKEAFRSEDPSLVTDPGHLITFVEEKHSKNEKHTAFKSLQGNLWKSGYEDGSLISPVYKDVPAAIHALAKEGVRTYIYSSGSISAQKLLFKYSDQGDLTPALSGYFDTSTAGAKTSASSYKTIGEETSIEARDWLFLSDNINEVIAAKEAGMQSWAVSRPGNAELTQQERSRNKIVSTFDEIYE